jgi:hypothetical protein
VGADPQTQQKKERKPAEGCQSGIWLRRKARAVIKLLRLELGLKPLKKLPSLIPCGQLRTAIRSIYPAELTPLQELSVKTSAKIERRWCKWCADESRAKTRLEKWKEARFEPTETDIAHVSVFKKALLQNIRTGWNRRKYPYVPNGHCSMWHSRKEGGNWNIEEFSDECGLMEVVSSGKPRVVTLYSSRNSEILSSLHRSLYSSLAEKGWLLVGSPTDEDVAFLNGKGSFVSVDYQSATDMINTNYVRAAVDALIEKSVGLTTEEEECLRVVANLKFDDRLCTRGQPMGSMISFPLLCLINKTVVDLAAADLLSAGELSVSEFTRHRCLINGDDLLFREPHRGEARLLAGILWHGSRVGLVVNKEKTMVDPNYAEINSTLFRDGKEMKKTNVAALFMGTDVCDVAGFAASAVRRPRSFRWLVRRAGRSLSRQRVKVYGWDKLFWQLYHPELRPFVTSVPISERPKAANLFPVCPLPDGYDLNYQEEIATINREVVRLRSGGLWAETLVPRPRWRPVMNVGGLSLREALKVGHTNGGQELTLAVLSRRWKELSWDKVRESDTPCMTEFDSSPFDDLPRGFAAIELIRGAKNAERIPRGPTRKEEGRCAGSSDFVSLSGS